MLELRNLPPLNPNYTPPRPWRCATHADHACDGPVIGAIGSIPVCANGAHAERATRHEDAARLERRLADPAFRAMLDREAAAENAFERRHS